MNKIISVIPKYKQMKDILESDIVNGVYKKGDRLPSERKLAKEYGMNFTTVNKAITLLVSEGYVVREHGRGTFVTLRENNKILFLLPDVSLIDKNANPYNWFVSFDVISGFIMATEMNKFAFEISSYKNLNFDLLDTNTNIILFNIDIDDQYLYKLREITNRILLIDIKNHKNYFTINYDYKREIYEGVKYLVNNGCKKLIYLKSDDKHFSHEERYKGFLKGLKKSGLKFDPKRTLHTGPDIESNYNVVLNLIKQKVKFDGIMASTDLKGIGAYYALTENGYSIPDDIQILGFDNIAHFYDSMVGLSSISIPRKEIGNIVIDNLKKGNLKNDNIILKGEIINRKTTK